MTIMSTSEYNQLNNDITGTAIVATLASTENIIMYSFTSLLVMQRKC